MEGLQETQWEVSFPSDAGLIDAQDQFCEPNARHTVQFSLIFFTSNVNCDNITIHKTSVDLWQHPDFTLDQLYAEYGDLTCFRQLKLLIFKLRSSVTAQDASVICFRNSGHNVLCWAFRSQKNISMAASLFINRRRPSWRPTFY